MSHNADHSEEAVPDLPTMSDDVDVEAAVETMGLDEHPVFQIDTCVYRYRGIHLGELVVDRLSRSAKTQSGRFPLDDIWYDYHNGNLELGKWSCEFTPADAPDEREAITQTSSDSDEPTVEISASTARTAHQEIKLAIRESGGGDVGALEACSPLALTRQKVEDSDLLSEDDRNHVLQLLQAVANERGVEISDADPLTDGVFQAKQELEGELKTLAE